MSIVLFNLSIVPSFLLNIDVSISDKAIFSKFFFFFLQLLPDATRTISSLEYFFAIVSVFLALLVWFSLQVNPLMAFAAVMGSTAFFIVHGFRQNAEEQERKMMGGTMSDWSKIFYLEVIDATFSIDGVLGAFAFTLSVPLIILGNGLGAVVVRQITVSNVDRIKRVLFLKNGAMYSILFLGCIMVLDSFGFHIPAWLSPLVTFGVVGFFYFKSVRAMPAEEPV